MTLSSIVNHKLIRVGLRFTATTTVIAVLLLSGYLGGTNGWGGTAIREITAVFRDPQIQGIILLCFIFYFAALLVLQWRSALTGALDTRIRSVLLHPSNWLLLVVVTGTISYFSVHPNSTEPLVFIGCATLGQAAGILSRRRRSAATPVLAYIIVASLVLLLTLAALLTSRSAKRFGYHGDNRWTGPWENPNIFGVLMGVGVIITIGVVFAKWVQGSKSKHNAVSTASLAVILVAAALMGRGMILSYSRGAWIAFVCGAAFLVFQQFRLGNAPPPDATATAPPTFDQKSRSKTALVLQRNSLLMIVVVLSAVAVSFWQFRRAEWHPARRALSVANANDFSWRNRVAAWEGAMQIMIEHPWIGAGWNRPERLYDNFYLPPRLLESAAIQMNDYLMLGAVLGIPALIAFATYLSLSLTGNSRVPVRDGIRFDRLRVICRAAVVVLAIGFAFDGGLFKLPTASAFWILLELGKSEPNCFRVQELSNLHSDTLSRGN